MVPLANRTRVPQPALGIHGGAPDLARRCAVVSIREIVIAAGGAGHRAGFSRNIAVLTCSTCSYKRMTPDDWPG